MMAVDILPTALPLEASQHFSSAFLPYLRSVIARYSGDQTASGHGDQIKEALERATVASGGELSKSFEWLKNPLGVWKISLRGAVSGSTPMNAGAVQAGPAEGEAGRKAQVGVQPKKKVLMLGAGMVAPPAVEEICSRPDVRLVVG